jgi:hypothetical protein
MGPVETSPEILLMYRAYLEFQLLVRYAGCKQISESLNAQLISVHHGSVPCDGAVLHMLVGQRKAGSQVASCFASVVHAHTIHSFILLMLF